MKYLLTFVLVICFLIEIKAQNISNVTAAQINNTIEIYYDLQCDDFVIIELFVSEKGDDNFIGPLKGVSGDVGRVDIPGNKKIIWDPLIDRNMIISENVIFRVTGYQKFSKLIDLRDGKTYKTVVIGDQVVMAENLAFNRGVGCTTYDIDKNNLGVYGRLYNYENALKACPKGWHLPTKGEFEKLFNDAGDSGEDLISNLSPQGNSGFNLVLGGLRNVNNFYEQLSIASYFWIDSGRTEENLLYLMINKTSKNFLNVNSTPNYGFSVRCFRDLPPILEY